jgi:DNA-directed RNA polymerase specialized sigma subunit
LRSEVVDHEGSQNSLIKTLAQGFENEVNEELDDLIQSQPAS